MTLNTQATAMTEMVTLQAAPHPFTVERVTHQRPAGESLAAMLAVAQPDPFLRRYAHVLIDGAVVAPENWARVYPKAGATVTVRLVPQGGGGGGKNPLRTVLSIAVLAASPVIASSLGAALGVGGSVLGISTARLLTTGVNLLGRLALNAIAPPPRPRYTAGRKESPVYFLQGAQNRVVPFGRVPKVLGRHRLVPPFGAMPYTETVGSDQYLRLLFVWGYGPLEISDLKIGETPLAEFDGVEIETRQGYPDDAPLTLYSNAVLQNDLQVVLKQSAGAVVRTTEAETEEISVDVTFPRGLFQFGSGNNKKPSTVEIEVQYAPTGTDDWSGGTGVFRSIAGQNVALPPRPTATISGGLMAVASRLDRIVLDAASGQARVVSGPVHRQGIDAGTAVLPGVPEGCQPLARILRRSDQAAIVPTGAISDDRGAVMGGVTLQDPDDFAVTPGATADQVSVAAGGIDYLAFRITAKQTTTLRRVVSFRVPKGQYDVRLRRLTPDSDSDKVFDECVWTALRSVRSSRPVRMTGLAMTALRIKATDQLNGMVDRFNGVVQAIIPDWTGESWVPQATANPAAIYRHVLQGAGNGRPLDDARIDVARLQDWHERCRLAGREFNAVIDYDASVRDILQDVAAVGRASPAVIDGRWSVVEDLAQAVPVQHFTPRNSFAFEAQKSFDEQPSALRVRFVNRDKGWVQDERLVFVDGIDETTAERYETLELAGVTSSDQAWKDGRYHLAVARLRPETYQFSADIEHLVCTRGDLIRFAHDVPMFGLMTGRIAARVVDEADQVTALALDATVSMTAGKSYSLRVRRGDGQSQTMTLVTQAGAVNQVTLAAALPLAEAPQVGDLCMFGESGLESVALVVKSIEPHGDLTARITCVDAAPAVHTADIGEIPPFQSQITLADADLPPPAPEVQHLQSGEESLIRHADGSFTTRIVLTLRPAAYSLPLRLDVMIRAEGESAFRPAEILSATATQVSLVGVEEGERYDLSLRYVGPGGNRSTAALISGYAVEGTAALPSDVTRLSVTVLGDVAHLSWTPVGDIDLSHYTLRYTPETGAVDWQQAVALVEKIAMDTTALSVPAAPGTYMIKAVDVGGRVSALAAQAVSPVGIGGGFNAVETRQEAPAFTGTKTGVVRMDGALRLDGADSMDDWSDVDDIDTIDFGASGLLAEGLYEIASPVDLGAVYRSRVTATLHVQGLDIGALIDQRSDLDGLESWDGDIDPTRFAALLDIALTDGDPGADPVWSDWQAFVIGDYTARGYRFRLRLYSEDPSLTPVITQLGITVDMPDRSESGAGIEVPTGGMTVFYSNAFYAPPAVSVAPHNLGTGDYYAITDSTADGFFIRFYNSADTGVARRFDFAARGYGFSV